MLKVNEDKFLKFDKIAQFLFFFYSFDDYKASFLKFCHRFMIYSIPGS